MIERINALFHRCQERRVFLNVTRHGLLRNLLGPPPSILRQPQQLALGFRSEMDFLRLNNSGADPDLSTNPYRFSSSSSASAPLAR